MRIDLDISKTGQQVFFISDFHFFHGINKTKGIIKIDNRPFDTIEEMHQTIIVNWNNTVLENDIVFFLGDLSFSKKWEQTKSLVDQLNGKIHFVMGNHDRFSDIQKIGRFESINDLVDLWLTTKEGKFHLILCHFPIYSWNRKHHNSIHIFAHAHHKIDAHEYCKQQCIDVGCNGINYTPISFDEINDIMKAKLEIINTK